MDPLLIKDNMERLVLNHFNNPNQHLGFSSTPMLLNNQDGTRQPQQQSSQQQLQLYQNSHHHLQQKHGNVEPLNHWPINQNLDFQLWIQHQAGVHFQNFLQHYDDYLAASMIHYLKLVSSIDQPQPQSPSLAKLDPVFSIMDENKNDGTKILNQNSIRSSIDLNNNNKSTRMVGNRQQPSQQQKQQHQDERMSRPFRCDWPGCDRCFPTAQILNHHRRFHIRKSNYQCKHCSVRLLNSEEFEEHIIKCENNLKDSGKLLIDNSNSSSSSSPSATLQPFQNSAAVDKIYYSYSSASSSSSSTSSSVAVEDDPIIIESLNRKFLIDQLISPKNSNNRDLKKALLAVQTDRTKNIPNNNDDDNNGDKNKNKSPMSLSNSTIISSSSSSQSSNNNEYKKTRYSGIGRYRCPWPECFYTPHFLRDLRRHMFKHTGDKRYKCPKCRFVSVWKTSLLQHQRKKHHDNDI